MLEVVRQRLEPERLASRCMRERLCEQPVGEPGIPWQERSVQVCADRSSKPAAFESALAVVAEAEDDTSERLSARVERRAAGVVLEAGERAAGPGAVEQHVADHASLAGDRVQREETDTRQLGSITVAVEVPEQLVAAADSEQRRSAGHRRAEALALGGEIDSDQRLLAVLAAADVDEVVGRRLELVTHRT